MKRIFDIALSLFGLIVTLPVMLVVALVIWWRDGGPVFYLDERMKTLDTAFQLIKFRTMSGVPDGQNTGVTGGDKAGRITSTGRILRRYRLDEVPQLINVLKGDMSLVGPRPPPRQYTNAFPQTYVKVLKSRPGITGLATLHFHRHEERLIKATTTREETDHIYVTRCVPRKATLDLIYQRNASLCFDIAILWQTLRKIVSR